MNKITEVDFTPEANEAKPSLKFNDLVFIELDILSGKTSAKEIQKYEREVQRYHRELQRGENMGMSIDIDEPEEPNMKIEYRKQWWNITDKEIHSWYNDWDEERDCEAIIIDYSYAGGIDQINIRMTKPEWIALLESLGAVHIK